MTRPSRQRHRIRAVLFGTIASTLIACTSSDGVSMDSTRSTPTSTTVAMVDSISDSTTATTATTSSTTTTTATTAAPTTTLLQIDCGLDSGRRTIDGRDAEVDVPESFGRADNPTGVQSPLLVLLHGFGGNGAEFAATTGLDALAPEAGVVLAAPQGVGEVPTWHIGAPDDPLVAGDVDFLGALVDDLASSPCINADNVWLAGFSAGSAYTGVYGCANVDRFRGLVMVSGLPPAICPAEANTSIQITHGTDDSIVPFGGGEQTVSDDASVELDGVPASAAGWAEVAGCGEPDELVFGDNNPSTVTAWRNCAGQAEVSLLAVTGLNHVWAGDESPDFLEPISPIVNAGCVILHAMTDSEGDRFESCFG